MYAACAFSLIFCVGRTLWSPFKVPRGTLTQEPTLLGKLERLKKQTTLLPCGQNE